MAAVRTVLGDLAAGELGATDYHEHLFRVSRLLPGDELDDPERSGEEAGRLRTSGFAAMVEATPVGLTATATLLRNQKGSSAPVTAPGRPRRPPRPAA